MSDIKVGITTFNWSYADANPKWKVIAKRGIDWMCEIVDCPDYAGAQQVFTTDQVRMAVGHAQMWQKSADDSNTFFANLRPASYVHYSNGHGTYVRCLVTDKHELLPVALVGDWRAYDLPKRMPNGFIYNGYHADSIQKKKSFKPHASNVFEFNLQTRKGNQPIGFDKWADPRGLPPIDLTVPEMSADESALADKYRKLEQIRNIASNNEMTPDEIFMLLRNVLDDNAL